MKDYLLENLTARRLYEKVGTLPIVDYHCHLSPREIYEDVPFENLGQIWLGGDHYKWRLMRTAGIDEDYITGAESWHDKFIKYAQVLEMAAGNPLYHWSAMELSMYFGINTPIRQDTAEQIWQQANACIRKQKISPRKLVLQSGVETLCTTDDPTDDLHWHDLIREDEAFPVKVLPSFRTDNILLVHRPGYADYLKKLENAAQTAVVSLKGLKKALELRLAYFTKRGCKVSDVGIPFFPDRAAPEEEAEETFRKILAGENISQKEYLGWIGNLYVFLGRLYRENGVVMQWHLAVMRNSNDAMFRALGPDCGGDTMGDLISGRDLVTMLNAVNETGGMPKTILYSLNPGFSAQLACIAGAFRNVTCGAAWWFCDHKRGIQEQIQIMAENSALGNFYGMLTDSRSFLSYARHDYFRRILCSMVGSWVELGEYDLTSAEMLVKRVCYENVKEMVG